MTPELERLLALLENQNTGELVSLLTQTSQQLADLSQHLNSFPSAELAALSQSGSQVIEAVKQQQQAQEQLLTTVITRVNQMGEALQQTTGVMLAEIERLRGLQNEQEQANAAAQQVTDQAVDLAHTLAQIVVAIQESEQTQEG